MWNGPLDWAAMKRIMQPFRLSLAGAPFVPGADMLLRCGSWKVPFCSICLKAADLCDNLKTLDVKVSLTHRHLNGSFVLPCDLSRHSHMILPKRGELKAAERAPWRELLTSDQGTLKRPSQMTLILWKMWEKEGWIRFQASACKCAHFHMRRYIIQQPWWTGLTPQVSQMWLLASLVFYRWQENTVWSLTKLTLVSLP